MQFGTGEQEMLLYNRENAFIHLKREMQTLFLKLSLL